MAAPVTIRTPRLVLRPVQPGDAPALLPLIRNWNVVKWLARAPWPYTAEDMTWFMDNVAGPRALTADPVYALLLGGQTPIGAAECSTRGAPQDAGPDLGFWMGEPYWGRGYMSEAVSALIARAFDDAAITELRSAVFKGNDRSLSLHEKLGFTWTGMRLAQCASRGAEWPLITLRLAREHFRPR
jgi:RimJ/RimL family protein N-acetyltransferase